MKPKQKKCIELMVLGTKTQAEIARELKVTEQTICNWKKDGKFVAELEKANHIVINSLVPRAINKTAALLNAESEQVQLAAAKDILDRAGYKPPKEVKADIGITKPGEKLADVFAQLQENCKPLEE